MVARRTLRSWPLIGPAVAVCLVVVIATPGGPTAASFGDRDGVGIERGDAAIVTAGPATPRQVGDRHARSPSPDASVALPGDRPGLIRPPDTQRARAGLECVRPGARCSSSSVNARGPPSSRA